MPVRNGPHTGCVLPLHATGCPDWAPEGQQLKCPDGGTCHHECPTIAGCFRVIYAGPLSGVYDGDQWPDHLYQQALDEDTGHL